MIALKKLPLSKREQLIIIVCLTAALYFIGWHVTGKSLFNDLSGIRSNTNRLISEQKLLLSLTEESATLEEAFLKAKEQREQLSNNLPDLENLPLVLSEMEAFLASKPVTLNSLRIGDTTYYDHHAAVAMQLQVTAEPFHLFNLLEQLELLPQIIYLDYLTWSRQGESGIKMEIQLYLLFYHPEPGESCKEGFY